VIVSAWGGAVYLSGKDSMFLTLTLMVGLKDLITDSYCISDISRITVSFVAPVYVVVVPS
jgi:hypothetical protein